MKKHQLFKKSVYVRIVPPVYMSNVSILAQVKDSTITHQEIIHDGIFNMKQETIEIEPFLLIEHGDFYDISETILEYYGNRLRTLVENDLNEKCLFKGDKLFVCINDLTPTIPMLDESLKVEFRLRRRSQVTN
jgi:hypothetical protein